MSGTLPGKKALRLMEIFQDFIFEAAHRLPNVPLGHKCARLHGHSFRVSVHVRGKMDEMAGWVMDYADIREAFRPVHEQLDHRYLNDIEGLSNPTSENLGRWIWKNLKPRLPLLSRLVIHETCNSGCIVCGENEG